MYIKIMSGEDISDGDERKTYRLLQDVQEVEFGRTDAGSLMVDVLFSDGCHLVTYPEGNVYVLGSDGAVVSSMAVAQYHPDPEPDLPDEAEVDVFLKSIRDALEASSDEPGEKGDVDGIHVGPKPDNEEIASAKTARAILDTIKVRDAIDKLGLALAEHSHKWSPEERIAYQNAIRLLERGRLYHVEGR